MDPRVVELQCIMPIANVPSVMRHGLLSYERASRLQHDSIAMQPVQDRRDQKQVPGGLRLHQYANLYFHARNPMLYKRLAEVSDICILRVASTALDMMGTVVTDQNAASDYARFLAPSQWMLLDFDAIYARDWRHPDQIEGWRRKSKKCAEVLVPGRIAPEHIKGAYVVDAIAAGRLAELGIDIAATINADIFFK
jgi:ssDNA thymidine ADP-ribosyltransferase, DarT